MKIRLGGMAVMLALLAGCKKPAVPPAPPTPVDVVHPVARRVAPELLLTGTVAASRSVDLVARVPGTLTTIGFVDGAMVRKGQLLFEIEPDTYRAQLAADQAALDKAEQELARQRQLIATAATSDASLQAARSARDQALAKRDMSRIQLGYTRIVAPFDGRIGAHLVDAGNLVGAGAPTRLATLRRLAPLYVNFTIDEGTAVRLGLLTGAGVALPTVGLDMPGSTVRREARLDFVDNGIDSASGRLRLRATLGRDAHDLAPGMFVQVHLPAGAVHTAWLLPRRAFQDDQAGAAVLVVDAGGRVARHAVTAGAIYGNLREVGGLDGAARVIADGGANVAPGQAVSIAPPAAAHREGGA